MPLRQARPEDTQPLAELWTHAFPGDRTAAERARQLKDGLPYGGLEAAWVEEEGGRLRGAFRAYRMTEYLAGAALAMLGLAGVAVAPDARRRGIGHRLCRDALRVGRERGDTVSVLYPFRPAFYHSLGWGLVGELHAHVFRPEALPDAEEREAVRLAHHDDRAAIGDCYARTAAHSNGPIRRESGAWRRHLDSPGTQAFVYDDDGLSGYALVQYHHRPAPDAATLYVRELVAENDAAYRGLLGWIAAQRDQWSRIRYDARPDEGFHHRLADPRPPGFRPARPLWFPTARVLRAPMLRILDVPAALSARSHWGGEPGAALTLEVEVDDPELPQNRGPWHVAILERGARVQPRSAAAGADARLATDAATFAQIYAGELAPTAAARVGRARIEGAAGALDRAFRVQERFWLLDEF